MNYNIDFEIAGAIFLFTCYCGHRMQYREKNERNKAFRMMVLAVLAGDVTDLITAITISYYYVVPSFLNFTLNSLYFLAAPLSTMYLIRYIKTYFDGGKAYQYVASLNRFIYWAYMLLVITNHWTHFLFYFNEEEKYCHGNMYYLLYGLPVYYIVVSFFMLIFNRHKMAKKYFIAVLSFILIVEFGTILQMLFFPTVLLNFFGASIAILVLVFAMETPDYEKLMLTMSELASARAEADEANKSKSQFLANMSHEIRTPINGILGIDEIALSENKDPNIEKYLWDIQDAGKSLLNIINDILDFSKIESGKMEIVENEYSLEDIVYSINNIIKVKARNKGLQLIIKNDANIPKVMFGDEIRLQQIIINLLNNGVKYTKAGRVVLLLKYELVDEDHVNLIIIVKDTGIGIKDEDKEKLFQSFNRLDLKKNRSIEGTGLGLALTKNLLDLMEGQISVESTYGVGSEFTINLKQKVIDWTPMGQFNADTHVVKKNEVVIEDLKLPMAKILCVDDVAMNLRVFNGLLKPTEAKITTASSGRDALQLLHDQKFDLVFLDHMMPEMDGVETLRRFKEDTEAASAQAPIIMLTANAISGVKEDYLAKGFSDYLSKPVSRDMLFEVLKKYLVKNE